MEFYFVQAFLWSHKSCMEIDKLWLKCAWQLRSFITSNSQFLTSNKFKVFFFFFRFSWNCMLSMLNFPFSSSFQVYVEFMCTSENSEDECGKRKISLKLEILLKTLKRWKWFLKLENYIYGSIGHKKYLMNNSNKKISLKTKKLREKLSLWCV